VSWGLGALEAGCLNELTVFIIQRAIYSLGWNFKLCLSGRIRGRTRLKFILRIFQNGVSESRSRAFLEMTSFWQILRPVIKHFVVGGRYVFLVFDVCINKRIYLKILYLESMRGPRQIVSGRNLIVGDPKNLISLFEIGLDNFFH
jgi:hypothetical protein